MDLGLERINRLLNALTPAGQDKAPHLAVPIVHVAGTNGKGSICAYLASILQAAGYRVGRYNSPHLVTPRDTIQVDGQAISQADYEYASSIVKAADAQHGLESTSFELLTATAFYWFAYGHLRHAGDHSHEQEQGTQDTTTDQKQKIQRRVDVAIIEVGVGGRLDATNVVDRPEVSVIASIGLDHAGLLGNTIEQVAFEKAGIVKRGVPVVVAPQKDTMNGGGGESVYKVIEDRSRAVEASYLIRVKAAKWITDSSLSTSASALPQIGQWAIAEDALKVWIPLLGDFQLDNAATAIAAIRVMQRQGQKHSRWDKITDAAIQQGIERTRWPGRLQWIEASEAPSYVRGKVLVDGAHNPAAAIALRAFIDAYLSTIQDNESESRSTSESQSESQSSTPKTIAKGETRSVRRPRIHWVIAFTRGKDMKEMFEILFPKDRDMTNDTYLAVEFSTPEGMPWVSPISSSEILQCLEEMLQTREQTGPLIAHGCNKDLADGLAWVGSQREERDIVVVCGSLYLVADLLRLLPS
ncbi:hypothetical protein BGZ94_005034 [Podila epigama]|nr:hypothetical protein BGZ94_005034 [Podila epigama]